MARADQILRMKKLNVQPSPDHLPIHGWRRGSFGSKPMQPSACPPQLRTAFHVAAVLVLLADRHAAIGTVFHLVAAVTCRPVLRSRIEPKIEPPKRRA